MSRKYTLISSATYIPLSPNELLVKGNSLEGFSILVEDPEKRGVAALIFRALESSGHTPEGLVAALNLDISPDDCKELLESMREGGAISCVEDNDESPEVESVWSAFVRYGEMPDPALLRTVTVLGNKDAEGLLDVARDWGVPLEVIPPEQLNFSAFSPEQSQCREHIKPVVYVSFGSERAEMYRINEQAVLAGVPVLYARLDGVEYTVGPYAVPGQSACAWEAERLLARSSADREQCETLLQHRSTKGYESTGCVGKSGISLALAVSLLELSLRGTSERAGTVLHGRVTTLRTSVHSVMRLPRCPICLPMQPLIRNPLY